MVRSSHSVIILLKEKKMNLKDKLNLVNTNRQKLNKIQRMTLRNYQQLCRNINKEGTIIGNMSANTIVHAETFLGRMILKYNL